MRAVEIVWLGLFMAVLLAVVFLYQRIIDEVERDFPLEDRPSWHPWGNWRLKHPPYLALHRRMYPRSRLRRGLAITLAVQAGILVTGIAALYYRV